MAEIRIDVEVDKTAVDAAVRRVAETLEPPVLTDAVADGADVFVDAVKDTAPVRSGALRDSVDKSQSGPAEFLIGPDTDVIPYAVIQNYGGDIYPVRAKALRFEIDGKVIFAQHVHLPGSHYMERAFEEGREPALRAVIAAIDRHIDTL